MPDDPEDPTSAAAAKPVYTIIEQKHSRWWEVRDPENELVCLTVYRKGAREVVRRSQPERAAIKQNRSRGTESPAAAAMLSSALTPQRPRCGARHTAACGVRDRPPQRFSAAPQPSGEQIFRVLSLVPDVEHVDGILPDRKEDLVRVEEPLANGFGEEPVFVSHSALIGRRYKIAYGGSNPVVPLLGVLRAGVA
jgi:hypothetical protein